MKPHKLLHPSQTHWLSLQMVVTRRLEQYGALVIYFTDAVLSERLLVFENTLKNLPTYHQPLSSVSIFYTASLHWTQ